MWKINQGYQSLFEYLVERNFLFARWFDRALYPDESYRLKKAPYRPTNGRRWNPNPYWGQQMVGAFQPLANLAKDFIDTFKPYKSGYYAIRDLEQPLRGIGNILKGVANVIGAPLVFLGNLFRFAFISGSIEQFIGNVGYNFYETGTWMLDGVTSAVRGTIQLVTTPLNMLIRMPFRGLLTLVSSTPLVEKNAGVERLMTEGEQAVQIRNANILINVCFELHRKLRKATYLGQLTDIPEEGERKHFDELNQEQSKTNYDVNHNPTQKNQENIVISGLKYLSIFTLHSCNEARHDKLKQTAKMLGVDQIYPETMRGMKSH